VRHLFDMRKKARFEPGALLQPQRLVAALHAGLHNATVGMALAHAVHVRGADLEAFGCLATGALGGQHPLAQIIRIRLPVASHRFAPSHRPSIRCD
jgi:hypothetical protein